MKKRLNAAFSTGSAAPFVLRVPVMFHDVDAAGTAYYPRLIDFCHCAFEAFFNARIGPAYSKVIGAGVGFPSVHFDVDFLKPIRHGDVIDIGVRVAHLGRTSVTLAFEARRGRTVLFRAKNVVVVVDLETMSKRPLNPRMRARFLSLGQGGRTRTRPP
jgi:YbgC/YbaW family acyl-CoA thioester hydrolase